jgi:putative FmdB family regulatory protein
MPTYEYQREDGTTFETLQRMSDEPLVTCPETGQRVRRIIGGGSGLIFKGSGFYLTDYARKDNGNGNGKSKAESGDDSSPKSEKSAEKAAAPAAPKPE